MMAWINARLAEPSTRLGIGALVIAVGTAIQTGHVDWMTIVAAITGLVGIGTAEGKR
jgi:hypothetical protein